MNLQEAIAALEFAVGEVAKAALSDDKTPLGNSFALSQAASLVGAGKGNPDVVIFGDLNRFKGLNDQFGHIVGDAAIGYVGELIFERLVKGCQAKAFRRSGDEFVILLSSNELETFKSVASEFDSCAFEFNGEPRKTAMSFGYAVSAGAASFEDLLSRAEIACQIAKGLGDGTFVEWTEEVAVKAIDSLRDRCMNCNATISCKVPRQFAPLGGKMLCCPCCGKSLSSDA
ncbi:MAG TPA: GGDEF domain-containing protein [Pyrinomonadaceae bacterium]|nr:GGDEF domain-containing protein [Pyrinomonadaceae bacterium]